jgi:hypothetical protein
VIGRLGITVAAGVDPLTEARGARAAPSTLQVGARIVVLSDDVHTSGAPAVRTAVAASLYARRGFTDPAERATASLGSLVGMTGVSSQAAPISSSGPERTG